MALCSPKHSGTFHAPLIIFAAKLASKSRERDTRSSHALPASIESSCCPGAWALGRLSLNSLTGLDFKPVVRV